MLLISAVDEKIKRRMRGVGWGGKSLEVAAESRFWGRNEHCLDRLSSRSENLPKRLGVFTVIHCKHLKHAS